MSYSGSTDNLAAASIAGSNIAGMAGVNMLNQHDTILSQVLQKYQGDLAKEQEYRQSYESLWRPIEQANASQILSWAQDPNWQNLMGYAAEDAAGALQYNSKMRDVYGNYYNQATDMSLDEMQRAKDFDEEMSGVRSQYGALDSMAIADAAGEFEEAGYMRDLYKPYYEKTLEEADRDFGEEYASRAIADSMSSRQTNNDALTRDASRMGVDASKLVGQMSKSSIADVASMASAASNARLTGDQEKFSRLVTALGTRKDPSSASRSYASNRVQSATRSPSTVATGVAASGQPNADLGLSTLSTFNPFTTSSYASNMAKSYMPNTTTPQYSYLSSGALKGIDTALSGYQTAGDMFTNQEKMDQQNSSSWGSDIGSGIGALAGIASSGKNFGWWG